MAIDERSTEDRLLARTLEALGQHDKVWSGLEMSMSALEVGDVMVPERLKGYEVEWAVVARNAGDRGRLLVLPADGGSLVGSGDLAVDSAEFGGPWTLRCRHGRWLEEKELQPWARTGRLTDADARMARERWWQAANGAAVGSTLGRELDEDPEVQEWLEDVVIPAQRALLASPAPTTRPVTATKPVTRYWQGVAVAASLLLVVAGAMIGYQQGKINELFQAVSLANPQPIDVVMDGRGVDISVSVRPGASHILWAVSLDPELSAPHYRLELVRKDSLELIWSEDRLIEEEEGQLLAGTQASLLTVGEYEMRLFALDDGEEPKQLQVRTIHILGDEDGG